MKPKTYILTLSRTFPKGHPREGEETHFEERVRCGTYYGERIGDNSELLAKRHTIRSDYGLWKRRIDEVNAGRAVLSVRQWLGAPRRSKQRELFRFDRDSGIGVEEMEIHPAVNDPAVRDRIYIRGWPTVITLEELAANDGLTLEDWEAWNGFAPFRFAQPMAIIHFTSFRYCN